MLVEEFMEPLALTQAALAEAMGVPRKHVNELCNNRRAVTVPTALILSRVFGNSADFWLNTQRPKRYVARPEFSQGARQDWRAKPISHAAG